MHVATELFIYRRFILKRAITDLRFRYGSTVLGVLWNFLHPLLLIAVYSLVFGYLVSRDDWGLTVPYPVFLCSGILPWIALVESINKGCAAFKTNRAYLKKLPVPEPVYVAQVAVTATVNALIGLGLLVVVALLFGVVPDTSWLLLPLPVMLLTAFGLGVGFGVATLNVFFPDVGEVVPVILRIGMWVVPVIYPLQQVEVRSPTLAAMVSAMPPTPALDGIHGIILHGAVPPMLGWVGMLGWAVVAIVVGGKILESLRFEIRDML